MSVKKKIQDILLIPYKKEYRKECEQAEHSYDEYIREEERKAREKKVACSLTCEEKDISQGVDFTKVESDVVIFKSNMGCLSAFAQRELCLEFEKNPEYALIYADEDYCGISQDKLDKLKTGAMKAEEVFTSGIPASERAFPFMKPKPAWESILSFLYIGGMFAVRTALVKEISFPQYETPEQNMYSFLLRVWTKLGEKAIAHYSGVLFHQFVSDVNEAELSVTGNEEIFDIVKKDFFHETGVLADIKRDEFGIGHVIYEITEYNGELPLLSILIPSKDNPPVLKQCIDSLLEVNTYKNIEIIIVDNGSNEEHKKQIEAYVNGVSGKCRGIKYIYSPQEFNYSRMNNLAFKESSGEYVLLLNDDMEVKTPDALERMLSQNMQPGIGAVGAKLLYPNSTLIQHVGITNAVDGPVHKFIGMDDLVPRHHGRNRLVYDCLAVTGACLMVKREYYEKLEGLNENLRVAYNDVDFCFRLIELGLRNVIRNDCVLYHHESLSRGADTQSAEKMQRLTEERKFLYTNHRQFYRFDPYEGACISGGAELGFDLENRFDRKKTKAECPKVSKRNYHKYPGGIHVVFDRLEKEEFEKSLGETYYVLQGFAVIPLIDNVRFTYKMVFEGTKGVTYEMPMKRFLRMNLEGGFPGTENIRMAGFCNFITESELPADTYKVGVFAIDHAARRRLYQDTGRVLVME